MQPAIVRRNRVRWLVNAALVGLMALPAALAQTGFTILHEFNPKDASSGQNPAGPLREIAPGVFVGATLAGTLYTIDGSGQFKILHTFAGSDGQQPLGPLFPGSNGQLYGVTEYGGANGGGTLYQMTPTGALTVLNAFSVVMGYNGAQPVVEGSDGNIYGVAYTVSTDGTAIVGIAYKETLAGVQTILHTFDPSNGDGYTLTGLMQAGDGNYYGTTADGGPAKAGTVYRMTPAGQVTVLYSFTGKFSDGQGPFGLFQGSDGNLYGVTGAANPATGATNPVAATFFQLTLSGAFNTLHWFAGYGGPLGSAASPVVQASDGNFYGVMADGGQSGFGLLYNLTPDINGVEYENSLYSFAGTNGGSYPAAPLTQGSDGRLYGTAAFGGAYNAGLIFSIGFGLPKPLPVVARLQPSSGSAGAPVLIAGQNLLGATSVSFHGTAATFEVAGSGYVRTSVPAGATSGPVTVVTPNGSVTSSANFTVE